MSRWIFIFVILGVSFTHLLCAQSRTKDLLLRSELDPHSSLNGGAEISSGSTLESLTFDSKLWDPKYMKFLDGKPYYVPDWRDKIVLAPPPANSSVRVKAELEYLLSLQEKRAAGHRDTVEREDAFEVFALKRWFGETVGSKPMTEQFVVNVINDAEVICVALKKKYNRVRPSVLDPRIVPCYPVPGHPAYPSGHSTTMHTFAYVMQELSPQKSESLRQEAFRIAWNREVAGLHYTSDTAAGQLLARQIVDLMMTKPKFREDLEKVRTEWKK
jgi:hypothetical protein